VPFPGSWPLLFCLFNHYWHHRHSLGLVKLRGHGVCWSGGSVLSGTGGPNRLVLMARTNKCMSRTRNHITPVFLFGLGCIRPLDADLVPWALLPTRTTVNGPTVSVSCPLLVWVSRVQFFVLELIASWKLLQPECHYVQPVSILSKRMKWATSITLMLPFPQWYTTTRPAILHFYCPCNN
jgi:hypothetical protein